MNIFRFIFTCITQAIKIVIGIGITIGLFFAMGYLIDMFAAKKTAPPSDPRLKPYADRGMPLTGSQKDKGKTDSLYLSFFETLLNKKPDVMPEPPQPEKKPETASAQPEARPVATKAVQTIPETKPAQPASGLSPAAQRVAEIRAALSSGAKPSPQAQTPAQAPVQPSTAPESVTYTLQVGSFQSSEVATSFTSSLAAKGYEANVVKIEVPDKGTVYRVRMGKYKTLEDAQKAAAELDKKAGISAFITSK